MNICKHLKEFIFGLCCPMRDFTRDVILCFFLFTVCAGANAIPITLNAITPDEDALIAEGLLGLDATDFCITAAGDGFSTSTLDLISDYDITPGGAFSSSQMLTSASIGHQTEAYGGTNDSFFNLGLCFDFPSDPLGPDELFSVTIDVLFLDDSLTEDQLLVMTGLNTSPAGCLFSYHEEQAGPFDPDVVHYIPGNCSLEVAATPLEDNRPPAGIHRDDDVKRIYVLVPEPATVILFFTAGFFFRFFGRKSSINIESSRKPSIIRA